MALSDFRATSPRRKRRVFWPVLQYCLHDSHPDGEHMRRDKSRIMQVWLRAVRHQIKSCRFAAGCGWLSVENLGALAAIGGKYRRRYGIDMQTDDCCS